VLPLWTRSSEPLAAPIHATRRRPCRRARWRPRFRCRLVAVRAARHRHRFICLDAVASSRAPWRPPIVHSEHRGHLRGHASSHGNAAVSPGRFAAALRPPPFARRSGPNALSAIWWVPNRSASRHRQEQSYLVACRRSLAGSLDLDSSVSRRLLSPWPICVGLAPQRGTNQAGWTPRIRIRCRSVGKFKLRYARRWRSLGDVKGGWSCSILGVRARSLP
jgi:hypothetical protein